MDSLARRYGRMPHEILALDPFELGVAIVAYQHAKQHEAHLIRRAGMVFPAVILSES